MMNINIGILGHIDSGKTSLAKILSEIGSTSAFDKSPQSKERGITLDLGFSSFTSKTPEHLRELIEKDKMQYTLVDCPGHAGLIKTIIGGAQIIDMMLLVVDVTKGVQTQTAECLVIGEIMHKRMIVVLNKTDLLEVDRREELITKMKVKIQKMLSRTVYASDEVPIMSVSALQDNPTGIKELIKCISEHTAFPHRSPDGAFLFAVDHCFSIKGQGTVMTGTVLQGSAAIGDTINLPHLSTTKKIKSIQMFRRPAFKVSQGDRAGICVAQFDSNMMERGVLCTPNHGQHCTYAIVKATTIKYFRYSIKTRSKYHVSIGHETVIAKLTIFYSATFETFEFPNEYEFREAIDVSDKAGNYYLLLEFERPVFTTGNCLLIGSKLDIDLSRNECRLAFWGRVLASGKDKPTFLEALKVYKTKSKVGIVERLVNDNTIIVKNMFSKNSDLQRFLNFSVKLSTGEEGKIESTFGQSGKVKVFIPLGMNLKSIIDDCKITVTLAFKKYLFDKDKRIYQ